jgi:hypothetical protein
MSLSVCSRICGFLVDLGKPLMNARPARRHEVWVWGDSNRSVAILFQELGQE